MTSEPNPKPENVESATGVDGAELVASADEEPTLDERLQESERKQQEHLALAQRAQADLENYRKRVQREREEERRFANAEIAFDLLSVLDNLERALAAARQAGDKSPLAEGVALVESQFLDVLRRYHVQRMDDLVGQQFDPSKHQALMMQPSNEHPPSTIVAVLKQGYQLHDRVIRPPDVAVAVAPPEESAESSQPEQAEKGEQ